jgi:hypothetical protein
MSKRLVLITAGETAYRTEDNFIVATKGGKQLANFEHEEDAEKFIKQYQKRKRK